MEISYDKSKVRVLIVDDETSIREMLALTLKDDGWTVETAANGREAWELLQKSKFHMVMSDINMPEMTGIDLLKQVKESQPQVEFLIMTSHATLETAVQAVKLGAYDYLNKPFDDLSIVPKKLEIVAEKILLRQQNLELMKRLKVAGQDLRRLVEMMTPLSGLLEKDALRDATLEAFSTLFDREGVKASWWTRSKENWKLHKALPSEKDFEGIHFPDEALDKLENLKNPKVHYFEYQNQRKEAVIFESFKESLAELFLQQVSLCYQKVCFHSDIAGLVNKDGLTKIYNHRYFQERLQQEVSQAKRQKSFVSLILMDVDHFKNYNDTNGHPAGDEVLRRLAELLSKHQGQGDGQESSASKRETDIVARYGGEEFVMILPFTPYEGALTKAERIREAVEAFPFAHRENQPLGKMSLSIGVATFPDHGKNSAELIELADKALYAAKKAGRNTVKGMKDLSPSDLDKEEVKPKADAGLTPQPESKKTLEAILEDADHVEAPKKPAAIQAKVRAEPKKSLRDLQDEKNPLSADLSFDITSLVSEITKAVDQAEPIPAAGDIKSFGSEPATPVPNLKMESTRE